MFSYLKRARDRRISQELRVNPTQKLGNNLYFVESDANDAVKTFQTSRPKAVKTPNIIQNLFKTAERNMSRKKPNLNFNKKEESKENVDDFEDENTETDNCEDENPNDEKKLSEVEENLLKQKEIKEKEETEKLEEEERLLKIKIEENLKKERELQEQKRIAEELAQETKRQLELEETAKQKLLQELENSRLEKAEKERIALEIKLKEKELKRLQLEAEKRKLDLENAEKLRKQQEIICLAQQAKLKQLEDENNRRKVEEQKQEVIKTLGRCSAGFNWIKVSGGYQCSARGHNISDHEVDQRHQELYGK